MWTCFFLLSIFYQTVECFGVELSHHQPKLSKCAEWSSAGITLANKTFFRASPIYIFVDKNNRIYVPDGVLNQLFIWDADKLSLSLILDISFSIASIYVTFDGTIYGNNNFDGKIGKINRNGTEDTCTLEFDDGCQALFVDIKNYIYCSMTYLNQVAKLSLINNDEDLPIIVAGNGIAGDAPDMLDEPHGIFVDIHLNLYVADILNNRIQFFEFGQMNGITIAGQSSKPSINLNNPSDVFLDADYNLFIVDQSRSRILQLRLQSNTFLCIIGCFSNHGTVLDRPLFPSTAAFDSFGNIYVVDSGNVKIQKFSLLTQLTRK